MRARLRFLILVGFFISCHIISAGQAQSYKVGYVDFSADLPEQSVIRSALNENPVYKTLSVFEKDFVYYLNYARLYPNTFSEKAVVPYLQAYPSFKPVYGESLIRTLETFSLSTTLFPEARMVSLARKHAADVAAHDMMNHNSSDGTQMQQRFEKAGVTCGSECINMLSSGSALEVLLSLLVDYQVQGFGHRKSLLAGKMTGVGVGMKSSGKGLQYTVIDLLCDQ